MNTFFGEVYINREELEEAGIDYPIKLEYYKKINEEQQIKNKAKYGISIIKKEYIKDDIKIEEKDINYITNDEIIEDRILEIFKNNKVTPLCCDEILLELFTKKITNMF